MAPAQVTFDAVHREFRPKLLRYFSRLVGPDEAADLAQLTFLKVHDGLPGFRGDSALGTWVYRIATNVAMDRLRRHAPLHVALAEEPGTGPDAASAEALQVPSAETSAVRAQMGACIREFVEQVPVAYRAVLVLADVEGLSNAEIAAATGLSLDNVKVRLHRGRARLRALLQGGCDFHRDERNELACDRHAGR